MKLFSVTEIKKELPSKIETMANRLVCCLIDNIRRKDNFGEKGVVYGYANDLSFEEKLRLNIFLAGFGYDLDIEIVTTEEGNIREKYTITIKNYGTGT